MPRPVCMRTPACTRALKIPQPPVRWRKQELDAPGWCRAKPFRAKCTAARLPRIPRATALAASGLAAVEVHENRVRWHSRVRSWRPMLAHRSCFKQQR
eukprot:13832477-Alexandrium_andersonii.AAC.1